MVTPPPPHSRRKHTASTVESVPYGSLDDSRIPAARKLQNYDQLHLAVDRDPLENDGNVSSHSPYYLGGPSEDGGELMVGNCCIKIPSIRRIALSLSLYLNVAITVAKLIAYLQTYSLSVLAALLDSVLDVVSQVVLNYTEHHSGMQRSSAFYPAGASRLEPIGVLTCAALMGMASFEVLKESVTALADRSHHDLKPQVSSVYGMLAIVAIKLGLLWLCRVGANKRRVLSSSSRSRTKGGALKVGDDEDDDDDEDTETAGTRGYEKIRSPHPEPIRELPTTTTSPAEHVVQMADPTLEALAQDHLNDCLSNGVAAVALLLAVREPQLWFLDPIGAIVISIYIIYSWFTTGKEQIEHLTGKSAPEEFIEELIDLANGFDDRLKVDTVRAYHFGPKFLVEIEIVMDASTLLFESHDLGMDLQYEIEGREEVERCFVHIDYQARPYDEHVVSKVPELRDKYIKQPSSHKLVRSAQSV
jgi:cation diffusion facilitator family transporter